MTEWRLLLFGKHPKSFHHFVGNYRFLLCHSRFYQPGSYCASFRLSHTQSMWGALSKFRSLSLQAEVRTVWRGKVFSFCHIWLVSSGLYILKNSQVCHDLHWLLALQKRFSPLHPVESQVSLSFRRAGCSFGYVGYSRTKTSEQTCWGPYLSLKTHHSHAVLSKNLKCNIIKVIHLTQKQQQKTDKQKKPKSCQSHWPSGRDTGGIH